MQDPQEKLAQMYVDEYLKGKGYSVKSLCKLTEEEAKKIMAEASTYAACKLAEAEHRARIMDEIHGVSQPG